jgi:hypothetical protein
MIVNKKMYIVFVKSGFCTKNEKYIKTSCFIKMSFENFVKTGISLSIFDEYIRDDYITDMMKDIQIQKEKYEPHRNTLRVPWDKDDLEFKSDFRNKDDYRNYVEKEYMYFRTLVQHYNSKKDALPKLVV